MRKHIRSQRSTSNNNKLWQHCLDNSPVPLAIIQLNEKGRILLFNKAFRKTTGYSLAITPTLDKWFKRSFPSKRYRTNAFCNWKEHIFGKDGRQANQHRLSMKTAFGPDIEALCITQKIGKSAVFYLHDILENKSWMKTLGTLIDALPWPLFIEQHKVQRSHPNPKILLTNKMFHTILGLSRRTCPRESDIIKRIFPDLVYRKKIYESWDKSIKEKGRGKRVDPIEAQAKDKNGQVHHILIHAIPLPALGIRVVSMLDITTHKKLIEAMERETQSAESQRAVLRRRLRNSLTAASIAHEIDTSLGAILLQAKTTLRSLLQDPRKNLQVITPMQYILNQAEGISLTIDRIRALISNMDTRHESVDVGNVVQSALLTLRDRLHEHRIEVKTKRVGKAVNIIGDETQIYLIILNLLRNAVDSLSRTTKHQRTIRIILSNTNGGISIVVEDSARGLTPDFLRRFERWNSKKSGMGLGLFLVRSAVENHHGRIHFGKSRLKGWKVNVWLPFSP